MATELFGTAFCDKNTWYSANNAAYSPSMINDSNAGTRWIGAAVDATASLQNFCGIRFSGRSDVTEVRVNVASWGRSFKIGTWAQGVDPAGSTFTKANIIPIRSIDAFNDRDDDGLGLNVGTWLRFAVTGTTIPGILFYCDDNSFSSFTNTAGGTNTNESLNEVRIFGTANTGSDPVKVDGTAIASSQYSDFGGISAANDGNTATGWSSAGVGAGAVSDWIALQFSTPQKIQKVDVYIYSWGKTIVLGYSTTTPTSKASFTVVRTIDVTATPNDDLGVPWGRQKVNTILIPSNTVSAAFWGLYTNDSGANILGVNGGALDRLRMMELNMYSDGKLTPALPAGPNPKPPASLPALPFTTTIASWTRTEFSTAGTFNFVPAVDTTVVMIAGQAAGAGGRVNVSLTGVATPNDSTLNGGDSTVATVDGVFLDIAGGQANSIGPVTVFPGPSGTPVDWIRSQEGAGRPGGVTAPGSSAGLASGQSYHNGNAPAAFTIAPQDTNGAVTATTTFTGAAAIPFTPTFVNASRVSATGLTTSMTLATAGTPTVSASIEYTFKAYAGQVIGLSFGWAVPSIATTGTVSINGATVYTLSTTLGSTTTQNFTAQTTGNQTVRFDISTTATTGTIPYIRVTSMTLTGVGQAGAASGASGRYANLFMLPKELTIVVGKGGIGQPGGQTIPASQNGTRGSGGGVGANGGDGVIVIYEYKLPPVLDATPKPQLPIYNVSPTLEVLAAYRTNYVGRAITGLYNTQDSYTHKLRPRTKFVIALMTGPGGGTRGASPAIPTHLPSQPTVVTCGAISNVANSGFAGRGLSGSTAYGGPGGTMDDAPNVLVGVTGSAGYGSGQSQSNVSDIAGSYGTGGASSYLSTGGGGCGGYGLVIYSTAQFSTDRTLQILVGNTDNSALGGAVYLYETESDYGPFISGLVEQILRKDGNADTATTQIVEQVLLKHTWAGSNVSQNLEQVLYKESDRDNVLQVSHASVAFIVDAPDPSTVTSQNLEQVLLREKQGGTLTSGSSEHVFMRMGILPFRISGTVEQVLLAELPSVFWLNFGTLQYPLRNKIYDSSVGRATSVQPGAYIQLESPHYAGTTLVVNGVEVGLSSPIKNNDQVFIRGGITNFFQKDMLVYTYYTKNGVIAREVVGQWKFVREDLVPTISRKYSVPYTNTSWIKSGRGSALAAIVPIWTQALTKTGAVLSALMTSGRSALADLTGVFTKALASVFTGPTAIVSKNNHALSVLIEAEFTKANSTTAKAADAIITQVHRGFSDNIDGVASGPANVNLQEWGGYTQLQAGYSAVDALDFERVQQQTVFYQNTDFEGNTQVGFGQWTAIDYLSGNPIGFGKVKKEYEYNAVGKSYSSGQEYTAIYNSGTGKPFSMGFIGTIAYSVLSGVDYTKNSGYGTGHWLMPAGRADLARAGFGFVQMGMAERAIAHPHLADRTVERDGGKNLGYFDTSPIMHSVGFAFFEQSVVKTSVNSEWVERIAVRTIHNLALVNLTAYRPAEAISGRGKASLYMGFDTLQDVQDYTEQYSGVTTLQMYNGYVYNLAVDKSFVCEIYYNGPISGLIQGG